MFLIVMPWSTEFRGGVTVVVQQLARQWQAEGLSCLTLVDDWQAARPTPRQAEIHFGFGFMALPEQALGIAKSLLRAPAKLWQTLKLLRQQRCSGINFHYPGLNTLGVALLKALGLFRGRLVLSFHGTDVRAPGGPVEQALWRFIFRQADALTTCSAALRGELLRLLPAPPAKVQVVYNGVDLQLFTPAPLPGSAQQQQQQQLLSLGGFVELKGHATLLHALARLPARFAPLQLTIAGGHGPAHAELQELAQALGIAPRLRLLRDLEQAQVVELLHQAQLLVQPSRRESFGLAVIEAAACGVPVLVSRVGGHLEIVEHGRSGWTFAADDVAACAQAIEEALDNPALAQQRAQLLMQQVHERFSWPRFAAQLRALMEAA